MRAARVRFESAGARTVETLVCEELAVSSPFRSWLLERLELDAFDSATLVCVRDAIDDPEASDPPRDPIGVELGLERDGERYLIVLVVAREAGDGALLSDATRRRICARRDGALEAEWGDRRSLLLAPTSAIEAADDMQPAVDATLSLESLRDRFAARETDRGDYRAALVAAAVDGGLWAPSASPAACGRTRAVVERYESLLADLEPALEVVPDPDLERGGAEPSTTAATLAIDAPALGDEHSLVHDPESGTVDLRIPDAANRLRAFAARYASVLPPATSLLADGDALVLRRSVPPVDLEGASDAGSGEGTGEAAATESTDDESIDDGDALEAALEAVCDHLAVAERVQTGRA